MDNWIPLEDARPDPNRLICVKGFKRNNPDEEFISTNVYVDEDGLFPSSVDMQDTHWQYMPESPSVR